MSFKQKVFNLIDDSKREVSFWNRAIDYFIITLIFLSIVEIVLESDKETCNYFNQEFKWFEIFSIGVFTVEYILRIWTADLKYSQSSNLRAKLNFIKSPLGITDLIAIIPFYLPLFFSFDLRFTRILRLSRLLRVFKLNRYSKALNLVGTVFYEKRVELGITILVTFILLLLSSSLMYNIENEAQPEEFPNIIATFWWAVATLTTVGYGDVYPVTGMGKLVSGIIALLGIGLVALPTGIISAGFIEKVEKKNKPSYNYCPHCGEKLDK